MEYWIGLVTVNLHCIPLYPVAARIPKIAPSQRLHCSQFMLNLEIHTIGAARICLKRHHCPPLSPSTDSRKQWSLWQTVPCGFQSLPTYSPRPILQAPSTRSGTPNTLDLQVPGRVLWVPHYYTQTMVFSLNQDSLRP